MEHGTRRTRSMKWLCTAIAGMLLLAGCGGGDGDTESVVAPEPAATDAPAPTATTAPEPEPDATAEPAPEPEAEPTEAPEEPAETEETQTGEALEVNGSVFSIDWGAVAPAFFSAPLGSEPDPLFFVHTTPAEDGFYFALEMYTTGYGALWTGELGEVNVSCAEGVPGPNSTGICPQFDPDGPGPLPPLDGFGATGTIVINQLDGAGYNIDVVAIMFPSGEIIASFNLSG